MGEDTKSRDSFVCFLFRGLIATAGRILHVTSHRKVSVYRRVCEFGQRAFVVSRNAFV